MRKLLSVVRYRRSVAWNNVRTSPEPQAGQGSVTSPVPRAPSARSGASTKVFDSFGGRGGFFFKPAFFPRASGGGAAAPLFPLAAAPSPPCFCRCRRGPRPPPPFPAAPPTPPP